MFRAFFHAAPARLLACLLIAGTIVPGVQADPCVAPGTTVLTDPAGDQTGGAAGSNTQFDIRSLAIAERQYTSGKRQLIFTLKIDNLSTLPPNSSYYVSFVVGANTEFVQMSVDLNGGVTYSYGTVTTGRSTGGALDPASNYKVDGTITLIVNDSSVGNPAAGSSLGTITARAEQFVGTSGTGGYQALDTGTATAPYMLVSATQCAPINDTPAPGGGTGGAGVSIGGPRYEIYAPPAGIGSTSAEPSIAVNGKTGSVFFSDTLNTVRIKFDDSTSPARTLWEKKNGTTTSQESLDPILSGDRYLLPNGQYNPRIFVSQLAGADSITAYTDDDGETYQPSQGAGQPHGADHQTLNAGPYPAGKKPVTASSDHAVYYCSHDTQDAFCSRSDDNGVTFGNSFPAFPVGGGCGLHGHVKVSPFDGSVYVPSKRCATSATTSATQVVTVSNDAGQTWTTYPILSGTTALTTGRWDPSVAIDAAGTLYASYAESGNELAKVAVSKDQGKTWSKAVDVGAPYGIKNAVFPTMVAGDAGRAAVAFVGTAVAGDSSTATFAGVWHLYVATTFDYGANWTVRDTTPNDPVQLTDICSNGTTCATTSLHRNLADFIETWVDPQCRVLAVFADGCTGTCANGGPNPYSAVGTVMRQSGGQRMCAKFEPPALTVPRPVLLTATRDENGVYLSWPEPDNGGSPVTGYKLYRATASGAEQLLSNPATGTYNDFSATDKTKTYYYWAVATNAIGDGLHGNEVSPALVTASNVCVIPGITVVTSPTGDAVPNLPAYDLQSLQISEPQSLDGNIRFVLKVASLATMPSGTRWVIRFTTKTPPANGDDTYFVEMTNEQGTVQYVYGSTGTPRANGTAVPVRVFNVTGNLEAGSQYLADGTIILILKDSNIPGLGRSDSIAGVTATTRAPATPQNEAIYDTMGGAVSYTLRTAKLCLPNNPPVPNLAVDTATGLAPLTVNFDASGSSDPDADKITDYVFDFGDGSPVVDQSTPTISHIYQNVGDYRATLTVRDERSALSTSPAAVNISVGSINNPPVAKLTSDKTGGRPPLTVAFDGSGSSDPDNDKIAEYSFDFGDGSAAVRQAGASTTHQFTAAGTYTVRLSVTDARGKVSTNTASIDIVVKTGTAPVAVLAGPDSIGKGVSATFDGSGSNDSKGDGDTITQYRFDFGDGSAPLTQAGATVTHTYAKSGNYTVTLTVTDSGADNNTSTPVSKAITVTNAAPVAKLAADKTRGRTPLTVNFDGSGSSDADDSISQYRFDFGDGSTAVTQSGPTLSHQFTSAGTYTVKLSVTDSEGAVSAMPATMDITVTQGTAPVAVLTGPAGTGKGVSVTFDGSGSNDSKGDGDSITSYRFDFGDGSMAVTQTAATLTHTYARSGTYTVTLVVTDSGSDNNTSAPVTKSISVSNTAPVARIAADTTRGNTPLTVNFDGSKSSDADPGDAVTRYTFDFGDGSAVVSQTTPTVSHVYQTAGSYTAKLTVEDNEALKSAQPDMIGIVASTAATPTNNAPNAAFTAKPVSGDVPLVVSFDATASSDPDAGDRVASYRFDFGDGSAVVVSLVPVVSHTYTTAGVFIARLRVVDSQGLASSNQATQTITASNPLLPTPSTGRLGGGAAAPVLLAILGGLAALRRRRRPRRRGE